MLAPARAQYPRRGATITHPGPILKHEIPIRTFSEWQAAQPGCLEVDLVGHCGPSTQGFFLCPRCAVDIATAWGELEATWGKASERGGGAVDHARRRLPMRLRGLDSDNGSAFINRGLLDDCRRHASPFTRSRAWKKTDSAPVEQRNGAIVRQLIGSDRVATRAAYACFWSQVSTLFRLRTI